jgi:acyl-CoA synthetase (AMP-forming)/AMP-acid ligase II/lysophospholipase L1-like esterase
LIQKKGFGTLHTSVFPFTWFEMRTVESVFGAITGSAERGPDAIAVLAPGRAALRYRELAEQIAQVGEALNGLGLGRDDRIVVLVPQGPESALAILAVAAYATAMPLDPGVKPYELQRYLSRSGARALITAAHIPSEAANIAAASGLDVIRLEPAPAAPAGIFHLSGGRKGRPQRRGPGAAQDVAILFTTSGTTGESKIVPQPHANLLTSADNFVRWYGLSRDDRAIIVSPLHHVMTVVNGLLAPLISGGSVVIPSRYDPDAFFDALGAFDPTWFNASPTFHAAVVARAKDYTGVVSKNRLRFIRSGSAPLSPSVMMALETTFGAPVLDGWGMAETCSHAMSNPLPPGVRKAGTVGLPVGFGVEVAVVDDTGAPAAAGERGEILVRGRTVTPGYLDDPQANAEAFVDGWLRTGDLGFFDGDGYVTITGRTDEIINRGGQKIAPEEVDRVLCSHPDVLDAACFPFRHETLGQEIMAAVRLRDGASASPSELLDHTRQHLVDHKVPRRLVVVDEIPRNPNGKVPRHKLEEILGPKLQASPAKTPPSLAGDPMTPLQSELLGLWKAHLGHDQLGLDDDFLVVGGNSLQATRLLLEVNERYGVDLDAEAIFGRAGTVDGMAQEIERHRATRTHRETPAQRPQNGGGRPAAPAASQPDIDFVEFRARHHVGTKAKLYYIDEATGLRRLRPKISFGPIRANRMGFRGPEIETPKPAGTVRIAFLGTSTTFDTWVSGNEATWPHQTWLRLQDALPDRRIDYVNGALPGSNTARLASIFEHFVSTLEPDVVIIAPSDINADTAHRARAMGIYGGVHHRPSRLARRSRLWGNIEKNLVIARRLPFAHGEHGRLHVDPSELSSEFEERLERLVRLCRERAPVVALVCGMGRLRRGLSRWQQLRAAVTHVYYMPYMSIRGLLDVREEYDRVVQTVAQRSGCVLIDTSDAVPRDGRHYVDSNHFSDAGSARLASAVSDALVKAAAFRDLLALAGR